MYIFYGQVQLFLPYSTNLKAKRKIILSVVERIRKRFNISIAEVSEQNLWQRSTLGFTAVTASYSEIDIMIDAIQSTLDRHDNDLEIIDFKYDIVSS